MWSESNVWDVLRDIPDPELPHVSLVDLGVIARVALNAPTASIKVWLMPTFLSCPALPLMREMVREQLEATFAGFNAEVVVTLAEVWTSDRISAEGRRKLMAAGIAPPPAVQSHHDLIQLEAAPCPHCHSSHTTLESPFGPTLCRAIAQCHTCRQPFEQFKPLG